MYEYKGCRPVSRKDKEAKDDILWYLENGYTEDEVEKKL